MAKALTLVSVLKTKRCPRCHEALTTLPLIYRACAWMHKRWADQGVQRMRHALAADAGAPIDDDPSPAFSLFRLTQ
jgi:hypothetical protein